jgi:hypothetical protein
MAHTHKSGDKRENQEDQSLIPAIKEREQNLAAMLQETRLQCEDEVRKAEGEGARRVARAKDQVAQSAAARRDGETKRVEAEVGDLSRGLDREIEDLERTAARNRDRAAATIVAAVWPEGQG